MQSYREQLDGIFPSVCSLDCPDMCSLHVHKEGGRITKVAGNPEHPVTQGAICNKVRHMTARLYDPNRLTQPLKRVGVKGEGAFVAITWEEAIAEIATRWQELIVEHGAESILPCSFYGNMGTLSAEGMDRRFFHALGTSQLDRTICSVAGGVGYAYTMGGAYGINPEDTAYSKLIIVWGCNAVSTNMHQVMFAEKARKNGAKIVVIDVHKNQTGRWADWFIPVLPGTDAALALGMMHVLFAENLVDETFMRAYTVGHEELREHVKAYDPETVSAITGVPVDDIIKLARLYGETTPSFIRIGNGPQHHDNGGMFVRTVACLPALTGQWQHTGGGAIKSNSDYHAFNSRAVERPDLLREKTRVVNMNQLGEALTELNPPVRSLFVYNSNPVVVAPDNNRVRQGLMRDDLFTVVHDLFLTETARYADIVLPATSSYENLDLYSSYWHHSIALQQPVIPPYGESKSNADVFRLLAKALGLTEPALYESDEEIICQALDHPANPYLAGITYEQLLEQTVVPLSITDRPLPPGRVPTPSGKIELLSERMERDGHPALPTYIPIAEPDTYPLLFVPAPNHNFLNSTFSNNEKHAKLEKMPRLYINEADAAARGIADGDKVRAYNDRGECVLTAAVGDTVLPGAVVTQGLWAEAEDEPRLVNALTPDRLADMGGGAVFFSTRVEVEKIG